VPTSVLLAVLAAAGLLALAPALTRRHDVIEPAALARATSTARVLSRRRRRRTVPGAAPVKPPRQFARTVEAARRSNVGRRSGGRGAERGRRLSGRPVDRQPGRADRLVRSTDRAGRPADRVGRVDRGRVDRAGRAGRSGGRRPARRRRVPTALHRRRRVLAALVLLNIVELAGVVLVGPGFWIGFAVTATALVADLAYLRHRAVLAQRRRRVLRRRMAWIAAEQAAIRREHERRAAEREAQARRVAASRLDARRLAVPRTEHYPRRRTGTSDP